MAARAAAEAGEFAQNVLDTVREPQLVLDGELTVVTANRSFLATFQEARDVKTTVNQDVLGILTAKGMLGQLRQQINLACGALQVDVTAGLADPFGLVSGPALP